MTYLEIVAQCFEGNSIFKETLSRISGDIDAVSQMMVGIRDVAEGMAARRLPNGVYENGVYRLDGSSGRVILKTRKPNFFTKLLKGEMCVASFCGIPPYDMAYANYISALDHAVIEEDFLPHPKSLIYATWNQGDNRGSRNVVLFEGSSWHPFGGPKHGAGVQDLAPNYYKNGLLFYEWSLYNLSQTKTWDLQTVRYRPYLIGGDPASWINLNCPVQLERNNGDAFAQNLTTWTVVHQ